MAEQATPREMPETVCERAFAQGWLPNPSDRSFSSGHNQTSARAFLLARDAAPDLLDACKWAKGQLRCVPHLDDPECFACSGHNPLDLAIARATGGKE